MTGHGGVKEVPAPSGTETFLFSDIEKSTQRYIAETNAAFADYLSAFRKRRVTLLERSSGLVSHDTVAVAWAGNFAAVESISPESPSSSARWPSRNGRLLPIIPSSQSSAAASTRCALGSTAR
jgi:hypothetical protein